MRILIASAHATVVGGIETYLRDVIEDLVLRGHAVALLTSSRAYSDNESLITGDLATVPIFSLEGANREDVFRSVRSWEPDIAYVHGMDSPADEAELLNCFPAVLFAHGHAATCISGSRTNSFPVHRPCNRRFGSGCLVNYLPRRCGGLNPLTMIGLFKRTVWRINLLQRYAAVIVASRYMADEYRDHGVADDRLHLLPLFPTVHGPDATVLERQQTGRILMVGRLYKEKGTHLLVRAIAVAGSRLGRKLTMVIAGDGPERSAMKAVATRLGVPAEFHGWVGPNRRTELMRSADLLAIPSPCPETFGLVGLEAACVGLPAVGFAVGGIPDWLVAGVSGEIAPANPPTAYGLADAMIRALADPAHLQGLSKGAWVSAGHFSRSRHVAELEYVLGAASETQSRRRVLRPRRFSLPTFVEPQ